MSLQSGTLPFRDVTELPDTECYPGFKSEFKKSGDVSTEETVSLDEKDIIACINRWHGDIFPDHNVRSSALLIAFLLDPVTQQISTEWRKAITGMKTSEEKIEAINHWNTEHLSYTQIHHTFSSLPGKDPWGRMTDGYTPTLKKLIPAEMAAMSLHTGKTAGKCFTLVNLITSCFIQLGVDPDDILVLISDANDARHAMALVKYEDELIGVNLMTVDLLRTHLDKEFKPYKITGIYNHRFSESVDLQVGKQDLESLMHQSEKPLLISFLEHYGLQSFGIHYSLKETWPLGERNALYSEIFKKPCDHPIAGLARYTYQSLYVRNPGCYLSASIKSSLVQNLATSLRTERDVFKWINTHIRYGSIFSDGEERLMTADQVLVFQRGSYKDQALLACALLHHMGIKAVIKMTKDNAFIETGNILYDFKRQKKTERIKAEVLLVLS
jgi:hypothetical protein